MTDLGPLEMQVLGLLGASSPQSVHDLQAALEKSGSALAYTTVMTVLVRLHDKGLVTRSKEGRRFLYSPAKRAPSVARGIVSRLQKTLFHQDRAKPILALLDDTQLSRAELQELRRKIDDKLKEKKP